MKILHVTDTHPSHIKNGYPDKITDVMGGGYDIIVHTGDFTDENNQPATPNYLSQFASTGKPFYFVAGNHDFWGGDFPMRRGDLRAYQPESYIHNAVVLLSNDTVIIGEDGWYDALTDDGLDIAYPNGASMNDWRYIGDIARHNNGGGMGAQAFSNRLAMESAQRFRGNLEVLNGELKTVIVLTHVPPFVECNTRDWDNYSPFYVNRPLGGVLKLYAEQHASTQFIVFCGHTHPNETTVTEIAPNIKCIVGKAKYGQVFGTIIDTENL